MMERNVDRQEKIDLLVEKLDNEGSVVLSREDAKGLLQTLRVCHTSISALRGVVSRMQEHLMDTQIADIMQDVEELFVYWLSQNWDNEWRSDHDYFINTERNEDYD